MRKTVSIVLCLVVLTACGSKDAKPAPQADLGAPQVATSIDDTGLPVDKSDQITSIDAATGDASGMPRDGGAVITLPKVEPAAHTATPENQAAAAAVTPATGMMPPVPPAGAVAAVPDEQ